LFFIYQDKIIDTIVLKDGQAFCHFITLQLIFFFFFLLSKFIFIFFYFYIKNDFFLVLKREGMLILLLSYSLIGCLFAVQYRYQAKLITTTIQQAGDDRGTTRLLYVVWFLVLICTPFFMSTSPAWVSCFSLMLMMCGVALLRWATHFNVFYVLTLATTDDHYICTEGPYRLIRHPGYAAFILAFLGFGVAVGSILSFTATVALVLYAYILRIQAEEQMMLDKFGVDYQQYMDETQR
jgi:protein-S-isoprenylcysteine O-methyltransferase Ste14